MSDEYDIRVNRPGESAVCHLCNVTVHDYWLELWHHGEGPPEKMVWCPPCLMKAVGCDQDENAPSA